MAYLSELRINWRALAAACVGLGAGYLLNHYVASLFAPHLLREFGWSKSQYALIGVTPLLSMICLPIAGRLTDIFGVRRIAAIGVVGSPIIYLCFSAMTGSFTVYFMIYLLYMVLVAATTSSTVYSRLVAENFGRTRGLALGIAACTPAAVGAIGAPFLSSFIDANGWRAGFLLMGAYTGVAGAVALMLVPVRVTTREKASRTSTKPPYGELVRSFPFLIIIAGMILCNLSIMIQPQLKLILLDRGVSSAAAALMISLYAIGVICGRLGCGLALDKFPAHIVAALCLGIPSIGLFILGTGSGTPELLGMSVFLIGVSMGSEGDIAAYLVMRYFKLELYSTIFGLVAGSMALSAAIGSLILSFTLKLSDSFNLFLYLSAFATAIGGGLFMLLGRNPMIAKEPEHLLQPDMA